MVRGVGRQEKSPGKTISIQAARIAFWKAIRVSSVWLPLLSGKEKKLTANRMNPSRPRPSGSVSTRAPDGTTVGNNLVTFGL